MVVRGKTNILYLIPQHLLLIQEQTPTPSSFHNLKEAMESRPQEGRRMPKNTLLLSGEVEEDGELNNLQLIKTVLHKLIP